MSLPEQLTAYLQRLPFGVADADLAATLAAAGQQRLSRATGSGAEPYSVANCLYAPAVEAPSLTPGMGCPRLELPELARMSSFYDEHGLEPLTSEELLASQAGHKLRLAWALLEQVPTVGACLRSLVKSIQVLRSPDPEIDVSYSHPAIPFSVFVSVGEDTSLISSLRVAESLLHEAMHLKLTLLEHEVTMVRPDSQGVFYSPWRDENRPVRGVLHGLFVFAAVRQFYQALQQHGLPDAEYDFTAHRVVAIQEELTSLAYFPTVPDLTQVGSLLAERLLREAAGAENLVP